MTKEEFIEKYGYWEDDFVVCIDNDYLLCDDVYDTLLRVDAVDLDSELVDVIYNTEGQIERNVEPRFLVKKNCRRYMTELLFTNQNLGTTKQNGLHQWIYLTRWRQLLLMSMFLMCAVKVLYAQSHTSGACTMTYIVILTLLGLST